MAEDNNDVPFQVRQLMDALKNKQERVNIRGNYRTRLVNIKEAIDPQDKNYVLNSKLYKVYKIWRYLQNASKEQILSLPNDITDLRDMDLLDEEKYLIGYCIGRGSARPRNTCGKFNNWIQDKIRIADNVEKIKHWDIRFGDYRQIENEEATWFIDAPYKMQIHGYNHKIDNYDDLADWCKSRKGQVIVCENSHGDWLPFRPLRQMQGINKQTLEVIWTNS